MKRKSWIVTSTHGPRPAGKSDECFYCHKIIGNEHEIGCVLRSKTIRIRVSFEYCIEIPESDESAGSVKEHLDHVETKAGYIADELALLAERQQNLGNPKRDPVISVEYVREATIGDHAALGVVSTEDTTAWPGEALSASIAEN